MTDTVKITIDDVEFEVPAGMNLVDAAKLCGTDIPVFCYHPKLGHDGNCRMCLVELALPRQNRETDEMELAWFPTLQTACTQTVTDGMAIRARSQKVIDGRREILELLLSSHPLDCPICDKGGECPLQELTMRHGPGTSRMYWDDKMHLGKHVPLGELIFLDRERCIHCARCIRFCELIADDHVLNFDRRGRKQQIITLSQPGFDSIFSGNTTDICPVGALTSADFRFNARPWEMVQVATICSHCPVGCNMSYDTRTDRESGGRTTIKRLMPRQNEQVNEIWICDKGRFAHHYMEHPDRLTTPLIRKGGKLIETTWDEALAEVAAQLKSAGSHIAAIAGGRLSNEDLYEVQKLVRTQGSYHLDVYPAHVAGGEFAAQVGVGTGTNFLDMGAGDAIMVVASDLHQEAPVWWLRVKAAAARGAALIVVNGRSTRLEQYATHSIRYDYGEEVAALNALSGSRKAVARAFAGAKNAVILVGGEGMDAATSRNLAQSAANLLIVTGHVGRANNGLVIVWPSANGQGASDMGFRPDFGPGYQPLRPTGMGYASILTAMERNDLKALYIAGADPAFDDPAADKALRATNGYIIVQDMFLTSTAGLADVVLPTQSIGEREGTYTTGERRVQRFYLAVEPAGESLPDWQIAQMIGERLGHKSPAPSAAAILAEIARTVPQYAGITYQALARTEGQWPDVSGEDLYYGGTAFLNRHGLGMQWPSLAEDPEAALDIGLAEAGAGLTVENGSLLVVPVAAIYDVEPVFARTEMLRQRVPAPCAILNPADARWYEIEPGDAIRFELNGHTLTVTTIVDDRTPRGVALVPRRLQAGGTLQGAAAAPVTRLEKIEA